MWPSVTVDPNGHNGHKFVTVDYDGHRFVTVDNDGHKFVTVVTVGVHGHRRSHNGHKIQEVLKWPKYVENRRFW